MRGKDIISLLFVLLLLSTTYAQDRSNKGKEFWLGYGFNYSFFHESVVNSQDLHLYISADQPANVTVSIQGTAWTRNVSIPANTVDFSIIIPKSGSDDARILKEGLSTKGISIKSDMPITVYAHQYNTMVSNATMLMPLETFGYSYFSVNYAQDRSGSTQPLVDPVVTNGPDWYSWFHVIAPEDNTRLLITPSDTTSNNWLPGQTYTVNLNKGEIYNVMGKLTNGSSLPHHASKDMTGSKIVSIMGADGKCHPIAVYSGSGGIRLCRGDGGENMSQQMFPSRAWGTRYLTYHMINNTSTNVSSPFLNFYRVCVSDPSAIVKKNGVVMTGLKRNFYYEFSSLSGDYIESDKPILVSQYTPNANECNTMNTFSYGDPEMIYLSPIEQGQKSVLFYTPRKSFIDYIYGSIYLPTPALSSLRVDGNMLPSANIIPHPTLPGYSVAIARFTGAAAQHRITCDSIFNAYIYGIGFFESYGFNAGTLVNDLNSYPSIKNKFSQRAAPDTFTCVKTDFRVSIKVAYSLNSIQWKLSQVPGVTPSADVVVNNPVPVQSEKIFGRTYYTYTLDQDLSFAVAGTYDIPVSYAAPDIDQCDQTETASVRVLVKDGPKADFNGSGIYCLKDQIQLKGNSNATGYDIKSYRWDFPDNTSQTTIDALKKFDVSGPQAIRYRIFADNGCTGDTVKTINVVKTTLVQASLSGTRCVDSLLTFTSSISTGNSGTQWYWDFGNGKTDSSKTPVVRYSYASGAVNLRLRHWVTDPLGCPSDTSETILPQVHNNPPAPPVLILSDTLCPGSMVTFGASLPYSPVSWSWDLGDGNLVGAAAPVTRRYDSAGSYVVTLQVRDANGCGSPVFAKQVNINRRPAINAGPDKYILLGSAANLEGSILSPLQYAYAWQPFIFLNDPSQLNPLCTPMTDMTYVVSARNNVTHCIAEDTMQVFVLTKIIIPNTFTPNNDGFNDRWDIRFLDRYPGCRIEVYNTAGQLVFRSVGYASPWDGRNNGRDLPGGTYYYVIDLANGEAKKAGYVTIIR